MAVYLIVNAAITDAELLQQYRAVASSTFAGHDVTLRVATDEAETIEGEPRGPRVVVLEFPDRDAFRAWYDSPAYREIVGMRHQSTDGFAVLVDGRS